ncbi:6-phosphogluconate dehydrogenase C-terminal domain-like protein [Myriangium duriaei CBS 260.36]|uniref:6-phosphogluconate dehydrogenase C-terminal domain-like protein n=1 Tax=Myriangium duriaei CBS 260.36 TaxID=1168546 RepID=A0A9P4MM81_9PEZI|nr:6-phosphogluconate dehydrogenase C-terminal domain-like protein [Myriangium duriaei CBS 260.36]
MTANQQDLMTAKIGILGTGPAGLAIAAKLMERGRKVVLWAHPDHSKNLNQIKSDGVLTSRGAIEGQFHPEFAQSVADVLQSTQICFIAISYGRTALLKQIVDCVPDLKNERGDTVGLSKHIFITIPGNLTSLIATGIFEEAGLHQSLRPSCLVDVNSAPDASRFVNNVLVIKGSKKNIAVGSIPTDPPVEIKDAVNALFTMQVEWFDIATLMCAQINPVIHPIVMLENQTLIEQSAGKWRPYQQGMTHDDAHERILAVDRDRIRLAKGLGKPVRNLVGQLNFNYGTGYDTFREFADKSVVHNKLLEGPISLNHRFLKQDVPDGCVPQYLIGKALGIELEAYKSVIEDASRVTGENYLADGLTLEKIGLDGLTGEEIVDRLS